ncbi:MAG TPA: hypothetical protein P5533_03065 [Candidatus Cloacimonadota bacterium]|nr:hypothetical protein [Candidatus Cloacimonadota bacterium]
MATKQLNLHLNYKGKELDTAKYGRDFTKKLVIGSSKYLFWQILDPAFPDKHLFLTGTGDDFALNLLPGSSVQCKKGNQDVDQNFLTSSKILNGTQLKLQQDMTGVVKLAKDWDVSYEYREPYAKVMTEEQRQIYNTYNRRPELSAVDKFNRGLVLLLTALTVIFLIVYDRLIKPDEKAAVSLAQKLEQMTQATRVIPEVAQQTSSFESDVEGQEEAPPAQTAQTGRPTQGTPRPGVAGTASGAAGAFGLGGFNAGATQQGLNFKAVTTSETFGATRPGGRGTGGGGGGTGPGGSGPGSPGSSFNAAAGQIQGADLGAVATSGPRYQGSSERPTGGAVSVVTGDASRVAPIGRPVTQSGAITAVKNQFVAGGATTASEGSIAGVPEENRGDVENIKARVNRNKGRIQSIYNSESRLTPQSGAVSITLYIDGGSVKAADVVPTSGNLTTDFLKKVESEVKGWSFNTSKKVKYQFSILFN